jgi:hypothetical protein
MNEHPPQHYAFKSPGTMVTRDRNPATDTRFASSTDLRRLRRLSHSVQRSARQIASVQVHRTKPSTLVNAYSVHVRLCVRCIQIMLRGGDGPASLLGEPTISSSFPTRYVSVSRQWPTSTPSLAMNRLQVQRFPGAQTSVVRATHMMSHSC